MLPRAFWCEIRSSTAASSRKGDRKKDVSGYDTAGTSGKLDPSSYQDFYATKVAEQFPRG